MTSRKCPECGLVNFADALNCGRCDADLQVSGKTNSQFVYMAALGAGMVLTVAQFMLQLMGSVAFPRKWFYVIYCVVYGVVASGLISFSRARHWVLALSLSSFYLLYVGAGLRNLLDYGGMFSQFYLSPVLQLISIPLAAFLGARFGSKRSWGCFAALSLVFTVTAAAVPFSERKDRPAKEFNYSTEIVGSDSSEFAMRLEFSYRLQITDDPWRFRIIATPPPPGSKSGWEVTVLRKDATFAPERSMTINVDGKEMQGTMLPITGANGSSRLDYSGNEDYSEIVNWGVGANPDPFASLVDANHVTLTWGNVNMVLPDEQVQSLRTFIRDYNRETRRYVCQYNLLCMLRALISSKS